MKFRTLLKIAVLLAVLATVAGTSAVAYHLWVKPIHHPAFEWLPRLTPTHHSPSREAELTAMLEAAEMPDIDPGERAFQRAHELLAVGNLPAAKTKLMSIIRVYPNSSTAPAARRIISSINLDELLSPTQQHGKHLHVVKRGDSWTSLTSQYRTTPECVMALNSMLQRRNPQVDDEWLMLSLDFHMLIEPQRKALSLWSDGSFVCEFPLLALPTRVSQATSQRTRIRSRSAQLDGKRIPAGDRDFASASKTLSLAHLPITIRDWDGKTDRPPAAILLSKCDMEELYLLTRAGNEVEFR